MEGDQKNENAISSIPPIVEVDGVKGTLPISELPTSLISPNTEESVPQRVPSFLNQDRGEVIASKSDKTLSSGDTPLFTSSFTVPTGDSENVPIASDRELCSSSERREGREDIHFSSFSTLGALLASASFFLPDGENLTSENFPPSTSPSVGRPPSERNPFKEESEPSLAQYPYPMLAFRQLEARLQEAVQLAREICITQEDSPRTACHTEEREEGGLEDPSSSSVAGNHYSFHQKEYSSSHNVDDPGMNFLNAPEKQESSSPTKGVDSFSALPADTIPFHKSFSDAKNLGMPPLSPPKHLLRRPPFSTANSERNDDYIPQRIQTLRAKKKNLLSGLP